MNIAFFYTPCIGGTYGILETIIHVILGQQSIRVINNEELMH